MKSLYKANILVLVALLIMQCDDSLLNVEPKTEIGRENFFNSAEDLQMYVNSMIDWPNVMDLNHEQSDDATTSGSSELRNVMVFDLTAQDFNGGWSWSKLRNINYFLENFEKADVPQETLDHFEGVARFHRARFYMDKIQRFGNVPWYDKVLGTDDQDLYKAVDSREFVVDKIFEDLTFAAEHVRETASTGAVKNDVVRTYMARYALFEGTFRKYHSYLNLTSTADTYLQIARDQAKHVMDTGRYDIFTSGSADAYGALFTWLIKGSAKLVRPCQSAAPDRSRPTISIA